MSRIFFTSDWHLGDTRLLQMSRDVVKTVDEMHELLLVMHNEVAGVTDNDLLFVLGDVVYNTAEANKFLPLIHEFKGKKILIRGNHDRPISDTEFSPYFEKIIQEGQGLFINLTNSRKEQFKFYATHYPSTAKEGIFNLVGHIHSGWKVQLNMYNVGVDANHFCPVSAEKVIAQYIAIKEYYDMDMWAAYLPINSLCKESRGKPGSYAQSLKGG